ncbi:hypothetical protein PABG_06360 [Paracoccidioides brasiliensis Pb03]|nr:hypothetical protein PABG_06360 [Paracoccidioides brasiliensis Pb03]
MRKLRSILALTASALYLFPTIAGHSWVEDLTLIAPNGTFTGPHGYSRGFAPRKEGYKDALMKHQLPPERALLPGEATAGILPNDTMCKESQLEPIQSDGFPRLKAPPGAPIALRYLENGHVSFPNTPEGKPHGGGKVYVYGTTQPRRRETFCSIHNVWNKEGTGGDRRGMLLSVHNFDDGRCHQITSGSPISKHRQNQFSYRINGNNAELWCQHDLALPQNAPVGKPYTLYWVWIWDTMPNIDPNVKSGKQETYTTCLDVDIIAPSGDLKVAAKGELPMLKYVQDQDVGSAAIPSQFENLKAPIIPGYSSSNPPALEKPASTTRAPAPSAFKPKPEPEQEPEPEDDDCDTPSTTVSAPQTPSKTPSNSKPAIIPLFASTSSSATATASISSASPDSASTSNNGGAIRTTFRMTFGSIVRGGSATASSSPTTVPESNSTKSPGDAFRVIPSANISPSLSSYPLLISGINFGPATATTAAAPFLATYKVVASSQASSPDSIPTPSTSESLLVISIVNSGPASAVIAITPSLSSDDIVAPTPPPSPDSISTSSENDEFVVSPITLGDDGLVVHSTPSTTARLTPKTTALRSTTTVTTSSTASATAPPNEKTTTIRVTSTITISSTTTQPPQSTATCPESNPPATILLPSRLPSSNNVSSNISLTILPTQTELSLPKAIEYLKTTVTLKETITIYATSTPVVPPGQEQPQAQAQMASSSASPSSGFIVSTRPSPPQSSPSAAELQPEMTPGADCDLNDQAAPSQSPGPSPPPAAPSKRAFRTLSSRFRRNLAEILSNRQIE